ncbi:diacylglycerol kinase family protein [Candidatus Uhrbacteria bacterium]|nr:diacylglycerol kinase family protein [Candidatus Uhrbacteria bacterium]
MHAALRLYRSIQSAFRGLAIAFREEQNFRIQVGAGIGIVILAFAFQITSVEWAVLSLTIGAVLTAEIFNSVLERIIDGMKPRVSPLVRHMKDLSSAAVLILAFCSLAIGSILFLPRLLSFAFG